MPYLGDFNYGAFILHGERDTVFGFLSAPNELTWKDIEARLQQRGLLTTSPTRSAIARLQRVIAASADAINGQRLVPFPVCPSCGSRSVAYGDSKPLDISEVPSVTFGQYQSLSDEMRSQRVEKLWKEFA